ncbi:uncharacterized protein, partial [Diadema antillarum]|uniref:uncharacterized protein n=1 Tax=Diadema antillarum TaxID=105358 RepID=UPI003A89EB51
QLQISLILPVHKGKGKPMNDPSNYRGISLTSVFCKLIELLMKPHVEETLRRSNVPDELQSGFQEDHSCVLLASILNIVIESNSLSKMRTFVAYLNAAKAFDTIAILRLRLLGKLITLTPNRVEYRLFQHMQCHHPSSKTTKAFKTLL